MLAKIFGVKNGTIHNWVVEAVKAMPEPKVPDNTSEIEFDEMWHFIGKKNESYGSSKLLTATQAEWLHGLLVSVTRKHSNDYMTK
jgi:hypothetical protein